jgi:preprotein translocase subunit SecE
MATMNQSLKTPSGKKGKGSQDSNNSSATEQLQTYLAGVRAEWKKITWPTWPQVWGQTIVVLVMVTLITLVLFIIDNSFHEIIKLIVPHRQ